MLNEKEIAYWTGLTDPKHGYGEIVVEDAKRVLALNQELLAQPERVARLERVALAAKTYRDEKNPVNFGMLTFYLKQLELGDPP